MTETELLDFLNRHGKILELKLMPSQSSDLEPVINITAQIAHCVFDFRCLNGRVASGNGRLLDDYDSVMAMIEKTLNGEYNYRQKEANYKPRSDRFVRRVQGCKAEMGIEWEYTATGEKVAKNLRFHIDAYESDGAVTKQHYLTKHARGDLQAIATAVMNGENTCGLIDYLLETAPDFQALWERAVPTSKPEVRV
jgi:hypothetical protein